VGWTMAEDDWFTRYRFHVNRIRSMSAYSEKLVYLFLMVSQPQSCARARMFKELREIARGIHLSVCKRAEAW